MRSARLLTVARSYIAKRGKACHVKSFPTATIAVPCSRCSARGPAVSVRHHGVRMAQEAATFYAAQAGWLIWEPLVMCPECLRVVPWAVITHVRMSLLESACKPIRFVELEIQAAAARQGSIWPTKPNLN